MKKIPSVATRRAEIHTSPAGIRRGKSVAISKWPNSSLANEELRTASALTEEKVRSPWRKMRFLRRDGSKGVLAILHESPADGRRKGSPRGAGRLRRSTGAVHQDSS